MGKSFQMGTGCDGCYVASLCNSSRNRARYSQSHWLDLQWGEHHYLLPIDTVIMGCYDWLYYNVASPLANVYCGVDCFSLERPDEVSRPLWLGIRQICGFLIVVQKDRLELHCKFRHNLRCCSCFGLCRTNLWYNQDEVVIWWKYYSSTLMAWWIRRILSTSLAMISFQETISLEPVFELICVCNCIDSPALLYVVMIFEKGYFEKICSLVFLMLGFYLLYLFIMIIDENKELSSFLGILLACIINVLTIYFALRTFDRFMINSNGVKGSIHYSFPLVSTK